MEGNTLLRKKQYMTQKSNEIAKAIIINKIRNQRDILKRLRDKIGWHSEFRHPNRQIGKK